MRVFFYIRMRVNPHCPLIDQVLEFMFLTSIANYLPPQYVGFKWKTLKKMLQSNIQSLLWRILSKQSTFVDLDATLCDFWCVLMVKPPSMQCEYAIFVRLMGVFGIPLKKPIILQSQYKCSERPATSDTYF